MRVVGLKLPRLRRARSSTIGGWRPTAVTLLRMLQAMTHHRCVSSKTGCTADLGGAGMRPPHFQQTKNFGADKSPNIGTAYKFRDEKYLGSAGMRSPISKRPKFFFKKKCLHDKLPLYLEVRENPRGKKEKSNNLRRAQPNLANEISKYSLRNF